MNYTGLDKMLTTKEKIITFVRQTLGCECPEHVFERIEVEDISVPDSPHTRRITVGGKLLIYLWEVDNSAQLGEKLRQMLLHGISRRDSEKLNRFRAVLLTDTPPDISEPATRHFNSFPEKDEKVHLHVVNKSDLVKLTIDPRRFGLPARTTLEEIDDQTLALVINRKSRIIMADGRKILEKIEKIKKVRTDVRVTLKTSAPVCSKTSAFLSTHGIQVTQTDPV